jgi:hypothetical protein
MTSVTEERSSTLNGGYSVQLTHHLKARRNRPRHVCSHRNDRIDEYSKVANDGSGHDEINIVTKRRLRQLMKKSTSCRPENPSLR